MRETLRTPVVRVVLAGVCVLAPAQAFCGASVWVSSGGDVAPQLTKIDAQTGIVTARVSPGVAINSLAVDRATGDVWALLSDGLLLRYTGRGRLRAVNGFNTEMVAPFPVSMDPVTGDVWASTFFEVVRFSAAGLRLAHFRDARVPLFDSIVDPADRSMWFIDTDDTGAERPRVVHVDSDGSFLTETPTPIGDDEGFATALAIDPSDGSCWASVLVSNRLVNIDTSGTIVKFIPLPSPGTVAVDPADGSIWTSSRSSETPFVYKLAADGSELFTRPGYFNVGTRGIAVDPADGSVWIAEDGDFGGTALLDQLDAQGNLVRHVEGSTISDVVGGGRSVALGPSLETIDATFEDLTGTVLALGLETGIEAALVSELRTAHDAFDSDDNRSTIVALRAFVRRIQALPREQIARSHQRALVIATRQLANLL